MPILCKSLNLLFLMTPRTACSAIGKVLREKFDGEFFPKEDIVDSQGVLILDYKHCTLKQLILNEYLSEKEASSLFIVAGIRNPFDSLVSEYIKKTTKYKHLLDEKDSWIYKQPEFVKDLKFCLNHSFDEWIDRHYKPTQLERILGRGQKSIFGKYTSEANKLIRFENLQEDFSGILKQVGVNGEISIPVFNDTPGREKDYRKYYSLKGRRIIEYVFQKELKKYKYHF